MRLLLIGLILTLSINLKAATGDTLKVQTFTFGSQQDSIFNFPPSTFESQKILMYYTLKCNPKNNPQCGEWDYLTYTYLYKHLGIYDSSVAKIDTAFNPDHSIKSIDITWKKTERTERFELSRFITPYGNGLNLGNGFTWVFDVSDYASLLHDKVHLSAGNWQELLDLKFIFIEGKPARTPYKVVNIWTGNYGYGLAKPIKDQTGGKNIQFDKSAVSVKLKVRVTGHGFGGTDNCSEFCPRKHWINIDGTKRWEQLVWRNNCAVNPVYPQGGTWVYQRANWCPGAEVRDYQQEITDYVKGKDSASFEYDVDPYQWNNQGTQPYYALEAQLIYYSDWNYQTDLEIADVIYPSSKAIYQRENPVCANPKIIIKNNGNFAISSPTFKYGMQDGSKVSYRWNGTLQPFATDTVLLPSPVWDGMGKVFEVHATDINEGKDGNAFNDVFYSPFTFTSKLDKDIIIYVKTNSNPQENEYTLKDMWGNVFLDRNNLQANTIYKDTLHLGYGCYTFHLTDKGEDGLQWWANTSQGSGSAKILGTTGKLLKNFGADFGKEIYFSFTAGYVLNVPAINEGNPFTIYPNPSKGVFTLDAGGVTTVDYRILVVDQVGKEVWAKTILKGSDPLKDIDLSSFARGMYFLKVFGKNEQWEEKLVRQ